MYTKSFESTKLHSPTLSFDLTETCIYDHDQHSYTSM